MEGGLRRLHQDAMLILRRTMTSVLTVVAVGLPASAFAANGGSVSVGGDNNGGWIDTTVTLPAIPPAAPQRGARASTGGSGVTCSWIEDTENAQSLWDWLGAGDPDGTWYDVICSDGTIYIALYVPPASDSVPPAVVLAGSLARTIANRLQLPEPRVGQNPAGQALVSLPTWWWVEPSSWRVLRQRTAAGPVWAEVTATPVSSSWDPGDGGEPLLCSGPGVAYDRSRPENVQSTYCSYTYRRSTAEQPQTGPDVNDRFFTVTVSTRWQVTWRGAGDSGGTLPVLSRSSSFPVAVAQRQTVVTGGSG